MVKTDDNFQQLACLSFVGISTRYHLIILDEAAQAEHNFEFSTDLSKLHAKKANNLSRLS